MPTSQAMLILHEVQHGKPISAKTRAFQRRRLQNRFHRFILRTFRQQQKNAGLTQKELADRIDSRPEQVNRWLSIPGNLTLKTISDLLLGMAVDLDDPSATPLADLAREAERKTAPQEIRQVANSIQMAYPPRHVFGLLETGGAQVPIRANIVRQPVAVASPGVVGLHLPNPDSARGFETATTERRPSI